MAGEDSNKDKDKNKDNETQVGTSSDLKLSFGDSLYLHPNDTSGTPIISVKLTRTENYKIWSVAMKFALWNHNKLGFIYGTFKRDLYMELVKQITLILVLLINGTLVILWLLLGS